MAILIKNKEQIEGIRASSKLAAETLKYLEPFVKPGIKTIELNDMAEEFLKRHGATAATKGYKGYKYATCISPNDVVCHGVPNDYIIRDGDIVNIDVTAVLNGYYGDTCRMYEVGEVSDYARQLVRVTKECLRLGIQESYPGNKLGNIGYAIHQHASKFGYSVVFEFCGHGVGVKFHEDPQVLHYGTAGTGLELEPGMCFTIEPMVNAGRRQVKLLPDGWTVVTRDRKLSAQWEHTLLVTPDGVEVLTARSEERDLAAGS